MQILSKILRFSWQEHIQKIKLFNYHIEKDKKNIWTKLSSLGREPTFNGEYKHIYKCFISMYLTYLHRQNIHFLNSVQKWLCQEGLFHNKVLFTI